tara:strand:+ start:163 stop:408 length:246 start_codon:yes stop_codon:yes gene_type:complete
MVSFGASKNTKPFEVESDIKDKRGLIMGAYIFTCGVVLQGVFFTVLLVVNTKKKMKYFIYAWIIALWLTIIMASSVMLKFK